MTDFDLTNEDVIEYAVAEAITGNDEIDYEKTAVWMVFANGFSALQWGIMYHPDWSPEKIHNAFSLYWGREPIPDHLIEEPITCTNNKKKVKPKEKYLVQQQTLKSNYYKNTYINFNKK